MDLQGIPRTILIVDDHQGLGDLIQPCLSRAGFRTTVASSGDEALTWLSSYHADLLLLGLKLPDMHGEALLHHLQTRNPRLPFIVMTDHGEEQRAISMLKLGVGGYLVKDSSLTNRLPSIVTQTFKQIQQRHRWPETKETIPADHHRSALSVLQGQPSSRLDSNSMPSTAQKASLQPDDRDQHVPMDPQNERPLKPSLDMKRIMTEYVTFWLRDTSPGCTFHIPDQLWKVNADEEQFREIFQTLFFHAQQVMASEGMVTLEAENLELHEESVKGLPLAKGGPYVKIQFRCRRDGRSHTPAINTFDHHLSSKPGSNGHELSAVSSIINHRQGTIVVSSIEDQGPICTLYLPAQVEQVHEPDQPPTLLRGAGKILVMDDEPSIRSLIREMLEFLGYEVQCAADGQSAIELFQEGLNRKCPFSAVILDLTVPGKMGGKETLRHLRRLDPHVKAIVASGYSDEMDLSCYSHYGFVGAVSKPFQLPDLTNLLYTIIHTARPSPTMRNTGT